MGQIIGFARASTLAVAAALAVMAMHAPPVDAAQKTKPAASAAAPAAPAAPGDEAAQAQKNAEGSRRAYDAGIKAYQAGSLQPAVDQLSTALRGGGLPSTDMARALYTRGLAYKKQSKPGLAISDLTSALWLKNGLADADRQTATAERAEAYRMAGLGDGNTGSETVAVADPNKVAAKAAAAVPSKTVVVPAPIPGGAAVTRQAADSPAAIDAARARENANAQVDNLSLESAVASSVTRSAAPAAAAPAAISAPIPSPAAPVVASATRNAAAVLSAAPVEGPSAATGASNAPGSSSTIAGFFSNLFSGGAASAKPDGGSVTTASTTSATPSTSSWSDQTSVASGNAKPVAAAKTAAAASPAAAGAKPVAAKAGKYKIHIAAVRSRAEAESLAQTLATKHGPQLKSGTPLVDEAVIGSMGTFYRVRVGSYVNADEPRGVCNALRTSGFDCLVVTN